MAPEEASSSPPATMSAAVDTGEGVATPPPSPPAAAADACEAPPAAVGTPRVSASSLSCNYLDQGTKSNLAESAFCPVLALVFAV